MFYPKAHRSIFNEANQHFNIDINIVYFKLDLDF